MMWRSSNTIRKRQMPHMSLCCLEGRTSKDGFFFYHGLNGLNEVVLWRKEEKECGRLSFKRSLEPLEPFEPLEPIEPLLQARQKPK